MLLNALKKKIKDREARIGVVGLGYVGLPLAMAFAERGFSVTGIDVDKRKITGLRAGQSYIQDVSQAVLKNALKKKRFHATDDYAVLAHLDAVLICVPTPLNKTREPDISFVVAATQKIARTLKKGFLVVLESTTYPGTTEEVMLPLLEKSGLKAERDFFLAFSPERVDPGNPHFDTISIPKVIGGVGKNSTEAAVELYGAVLKRVVEVSSAKTAEMVKLLENTFRSVNIALVNEMAIMCDHLGIDIWEVIEAAKTKPFGFMPFYPGPGIGGHCLPIDPLYLSWKSRLHGFEAKIIELASRVNEDMPLYVVKRVAHLLNLRRTPLKNAKILLLGVAYKRDVNDTRESPAFDVVRHLLDEGAQISYSDPWVPEFQKMKSKKVTVDFLRKQDCVVVLTDHAAFDWRLIKKHSKILLDTRNASKGIHV
ncbi:MAG: nucleotide sugar dehydrogenase [Candidatus Omnitrophica bacterium]|nr:nucleotide sugar dehydrogenase [Candidatus Omnitrophota bacterium]